MSNRTTEVVGSVLGVCAGRASLIRQGSRDVRTAFVKSPIAGRVDVGPLGIGGDEHVYEGHGGPDMALLVYSADHHAHWRSLGLVLPESGAFGENLTVSGLTEEVVHIGDVFAVGTCRVQVCQPRSPCSKLAARFGRRDMPVLVQESGRTGYLLRVVAPGSIAAGDEMRLVERDDHGLTVAESGRVLNVDRNDADGARRVLAHPALGSSVRSTLQKRLAANEVLGLDERRLFSDD